MATQKQRSEPFLNPAYYEKYSLHSVRINDLMEGKWVQPSWKIYTRTPFLSDSLPFQVNKITPMTPTFFFEKKTSIRVRQNIFNFYINEIAFSVLFSKSCLLTHSQMRKQEDRSRINPKIKTRNLLRSSMLMVEKYTI